MIWLMVDIKIWLKEQNQKKNLRYKAFKIASNPKYNGHERELASMVCQFFGKKCRGDGIKSMSKSTAWR